MEENMNDRAPYFCWDRNLTEKDIKNQLQTFTGKKREQLVAWILREASFRDVWNYITPSEVAEMLPQLQNSLGRWKDFWNYIFMTWHELGKI